MRNLTLLLSTALFAATFSVQATVYYVSPTGNDANNGTSQSTPWRTIARINSVVYSFLPGDQILFQRGGTWRDQLTAGSPGNASQPVTIGAYGSGASPIISGSDLVTGWTVHSGNIWKATVPAAVKHLYVGGTRMTVARYPNTGWLTNDQGTSTTIHDAALTQGSGYFNGGQAVIRNNNWSYITPTVSNFSGGTLTFSTSITNLNNYNWGYFLQNKLSLLDQAGEWYYDAGTSQVYLWAPGNANPNTLTVEGGVRDIGISIAYQKHHITITGLKLQHQLHNAVECGVSDHITVQGCTIDQVQKAISSNGTNNLFDGNTITRTYGTAMFLVDQYATVSNNILTDIAIVPGLGEESWGYFGMRILGPNCTVRLNRLENIGYIGIVSIDNTLIEKNYVRNCIAILNDGGGISFDDADGMIIRDNVVVDMIGDLSTSAPNRPDTYHLMGHGIYFGNTSITNTTVQNNTVVNCSGSGLHVDHTMASTGNQILNNVLYNNAVQLSLSDASNMTGPAAVPPYYMPSYSETYSGNLMYCLTKDQLCMRMYNCYSPLPVDFGTFTNNKLYNPYNELSIWLYNLNSGLQKYFTLERWQFERGEEAGSTRSSQHLNAYAVTSVLSSNLVVNGTFNANVTGWDGFPSNATQTWVTGQLDGGCLAANLPNNTIYNEFTMRNPDYFPIVSGQWYRMKCSTKSDVQGQMEIGIKPQSQLSTLLMAGGERAYPFDGTRREIEYILQSDYTENALVQFQNIYLDPRYWLDNVSVEKVTVAPVDPATEHTIFYNSLTVDQNFTLPAGCWQEVGGGLVGGTVSVAPFRSKVFYKTSGSGCGGGSTYSVAAKVLLNGPLNWTTGIMRDDLRVAGLVPTAEPYTALGYSLENTGAQMSAAVQALTGNSAVVDWVVLELRNADASYSVAAKRAALVLRDGTVVATDGSAQIPFNIPTQGKYLVVRHRNHLGAMTSTPLSANGVTVDYTTLSVQFYGTLAQSNDATRRALWCGNVNTDNTVHYTGANNDRDPVLTAIGGVIPTNTTMGYLRTDVNMDGVVRYTGTMNDRDCVLTTIGGVIPTTVRTEQVP